MKKFLDFIIILIYLTAYSITAYSSGILKNDKIKILILSGNNNHAWQETTPFLESILSESGIFDIKITNQPDTLKYKKLKEFDAIVSNWNSFPDNDFVWSKEAEKGLLKYLEEGGGLVFFHASASALYKWPEFKKISTGAWIKNTWHGKPGPVEVKIENRKHPITKGLTAFSTFDELWFNAEHNDSFQVLGSAVNDTILNSSLKKQPAISVANYGKGKIFHTILGHDVKAMSNPYFKTLISRGTEWAATSKVTLPLPEGYGANLQGTVTKSGGYENDILNTLPGNRILYKTIDSVNLTLDIIYPPDMKAGQRYPAIIFFFGGGWNGGSVEQFEPHAIHFAKRGMITIRADYRVKSRHGTTPFEAVEDAKSAIRFLRVNSDLLQIDTSRIAASGGSAGGHLAAATSTLKGLDNPLEDRNISSKPNALVLFNPVFDNGPDGYGYDRIGDRYPEISPIHNIREGAPPTIVFLGTKDRLIPAETARTYKQKMEAAGSRCDLFLYEGQEHGFFNYKNVENYQQTLKEADKFLVSLSYISE